MQLCDYSCSWNHPVTQLIALHTRIMHRLSTLYVLSPTCFLLYFDLALVEHWRNDKANDSRTTTCQILCYDDRSDPTNGRDLSCHKHESNLFCNVKLYSFFYWFFSYREKSQQHQQQQHNDDVNVVQQTTTTSTGKEITDCLSNRVWIP